MTTEKSIALTRQTFVGKVMSLLFNMLSRLVITFLPRSKHLLIFWLQSLSAVILEPQKIKSDTVSTVSPSISHEVIGPDAMILVFWMLSFKPTFSLSSFPFIKRLFSSYSLSAVRVVSSAYLRLLIWRCKCLGSLKSFIWYAPYHLEPVSSVSCVFSSWVSSGCTICGGCSGWPATRARGVQAGGRHPVSILNSLRTLCLGGCDVMAWWLQNPLFTDTVANNFH